MHSVPYYIQPYYKYEHYVNCMYSIAYTTVILQLHYIIFILTPTAQVCTFQGAKMVLYKLEIIQPSESVLNDELALSSCN